MEKVELEVLTQRAFPVLTMPGRRFPGVVVQGDTMSNFVALAKELVAALEAGESPLDDARYLSDELTEVLTHYARTLAEHGIDLPYRA